MRLTLAALALLLPAVTLTACSAEQAPTADGPVIRHAMGSTRVPADPERVVVLDTDKLDTMVSLGLTPIGAAQASESQKWPAYLGDSLDATKPVGTLQSPNLEAITALKPDLILGTKFRQAAFYDKLSKIAPTVFTERVGITWKENFLLDAEALGKQSEARKLLADYAAKTQSVKTTKKVSVVRFMPAEIRMYGPESFCGIVLGDAGVPRPQAELLTGQSDRRFGKLSPENLAQADGDVLFYSSYGEAAAKSAASVTAGPLWRRLKAVKHPVDDEVWMTGIGVTAAGRILDDLKKYLA